MALDATHALMTLEDMKVYLKEDGDKHDQIINTLINSVSLAFEGECGGRIFIEATYTALYLDGTGTRMLFIPHYPITSITTVTEDDVDLTEGNDEDYVIYGNEGEGYLWRANGVWSKGLKNIKLTSLKAGYALASVPSDLKLAAMIMIEKEFQKHLNKAGAEETRVFPDASITWNFSQDEYVKKTLAKYRRLTF